MKIFQWAYDKIKGFKTPAWLKQVLQELQDLAISILLQIGKDILDEIMAEVIRVNSENISGTEKFDKVFDYCRAKLDLGDLRDSYLDFLIQYTVSKLKSDGII